MTRSERPGDLAAILAALRPDGERLVSRPPAGSGVLPAGDYLMPERLEAAIWKAAARLGAPSRRVAASQWSKHYCATVMEGPLTALTLAGIGLDVAPERVGIVLQGGWPQALVIPDSAAFAVHPPRLGRALPDGFGRPVETLADLYQAVLPALFGHLALMIERVHAVARLSEKILWGNAGNFAAYLYETLAAAENPPPSVEVDRRFLLEAPEHPGIPGPNRLRNPVRYADLAAYGRSPTRVRRTCCLRYQIPHVQHCYSCPLIGDETRVSLLGH